ncbi:hypothetical protein P5706_11145 [Pseudomonas sp. ChxA]|uniref:hypothetical protein n=1 Tax=Pseudomonas sp. ChxA TaxID=3035473 RepID=UPI002557032D|nr:hypothetical protein [Pseudomonas sp. ChxA]MDL2184740.1 hypothetical protein [Pseudomonas sp. ChxA]
MQNPRNPATEKQTKKQKDPMQIPLTTYEIYISGKDAGQKNNLVLRVPENLKRDPLCSVLINYTSAVIAKKINKTSIGFLYLFIRFFAYLEIKFSNCRTLPNSVLQEYKGYLVTEEKIGANSLRTYLSIFRTTLNWAVNHPEYFNKLSTKSRRHLISTVSKIPSIPQAPRKPRKGLSGIVESVQYDDHTLLDSSNRFCTIYLKIINEHRQELLEDPTVQEIVSAVLETRDLQRCTWKRTALDHDYYLPLFNSILDSTSLTLKERLLSSDKIYRLLSESLKRPLGIYEMNELLKTSMTNDGRLKRNKPKFNGEAQLHVTFESLDYRFLLEPGISEEVCIGWLLAADRVQESGLMKMLLPDILITRSHAAANFLKNRSAKKHRQTTAHKENTRQYKCLKNFHKLRTIFNKNFPNEASFNVFSSESTFECLININSLPYRLICLAGMANSALNSELLKRDPKIRPFLELVQEVNRLNLIHRMDGLEYQRQINVSENKKTTDGAWEDIINSPRFNIPLGAFSQSRAIISSEKFDPTSSYDRYSLTVVDADNTAHTPRVKMESYTSKSETPHRAGKRTAFAKEVGSLMEQDARKVALFMSRTETLSYQEIKHHLGWAADIGSQEDIEAFNTIVSLAETNGYNFTPFGSLNHNEKRYFIDSPITVALMLSYKEECERVVAETTNYELSLSLSIQGSYISEAMKKISASSQILGKELYEGTTFPRPILY